MYIANKERYETMKYNRCGKSGLLLPAFSLGLWHNFGSNDSYDNMVDLLYNSFRPLALPSLRPCQQLRSVSGQCRRKLRQGFETRTCAVS